MCVANRLISQYNNQSDINSCKFPVHSYRVLQQGKYLGWKFSRVTTGYGFFPWSRVTEKEFAFLEMIWEKHHDASLSYESKHEITLLLRTLFKLLSIANELLGAFLYYLL